MYVRLDSEFYKGKKTFQVIAGCLIDSFFAIFCFLLPKKKPFVKLSWIRWKSKGRRRGQQRGRKCEGVPAGKLG